MVKPMEGPAARFVEAYREYRWRVPMFNLRPD
jgi:protein-S-isoprenylcysteine O-methyltransferase Ste14